MATDSSVATVAPEDVGLKREMGLIGATWAAETSIIGSGWLFASWKAAYSTGTSSILAWIIAGIALIVLALVHAELGAMYPVAGGTARFPHFAFGSVAGISFGFFSWVQAITVAPIECFAVMQYASFYWHGVFNDSTGEVTTAGFIFSILLMALFTAVNFLAMRLFNKVNSAVTWWKVAIPVLAIIVLLFKFHGEQLQLARRLHAVRRSRQCSRRFRALASCSPTSASSRPTSWPPRSRTRRRTCLARSSSRCCSAPRSTSCCRSSSSAPCRRASSPAAGRPWPTTTV